MRAGRLASVDRRIRFFSVQNEIGLFRVARRVRRFAVEIQESVMRVYVISLGVSRHYSLLDEMNDHAGCQSGVTYIVMVGSI
jgi:hypothetical protein